MDETMTSRYVKDREANNGGYISSAYCYNSDCPVRTKKEPWPRSDGEYSKEKETTVCKHCGEEMTWTFSASDFA